MENELTKTICKELENQLKEQTGYIALTLGKSDCGCEIALIQQNSNGNSACQYVIDLYYGTRGFSILHVYDIQGYTGIAILVLIKKAIDTVNQTLKGE